MIIGALYKSPDLLVEYSTWIRSKYDFFDEACKFYYDCADIIYKERTQDFTKSAIISFMTEDNTRMSKYRKYGSYKTLEGYMKLANVSDFKNYFNILKKYSLLREYQRKGFNIDNIVSHSKFELFSADDIYKLIRLQVDKIKTKIDGSNDTEVLNEGVTDMVRSFLDVPDIGFEIPFPILNACTRGFHRGTTAAFAALSNFGKSRLMIKIIAYLALVKGETCFVMLNEMSTERMRKALLTTVLNNAEYKNIHGIDIVKPEREYALAQYRGKDGNFIERKHDEMGNFTESVSEFENRLLQESDEYNKVIAVSDWLDKETETKIYVKDVCMSYDDATLMFEIRKAVMTRNCSCWFFDTFKNSTTGEWAAMKETASRLSEISKSLNVFGYLSMQLNDDARQVPPDELNSGHLAECKAVKHILDSLFIAQNIDDKYINKYKYIKYTSSEWGNQATNKLDDNSKWVCVVVDKNRDGDKPRVVFKIDLNTNEWQEMGFLVRA